MKRITIALILMLFGVPIPIFTIAGNQSGQIVIDSKVITTDYDSLAPFLKHNGWEKFTDSEKVVRIRSWKKFNKDKFRVNYGPMPEEDLIKDEETAIRVAVLYLYGMYGEQTYFYVPYIAVKIKKNVWRVAGTTPPCCSGNIYVDIDAINGKVYSIGKVK